MLLSARFTKFALVAGAFVGTAQGSPVSLLSFLKTRALGFQAIPQQLLDMGKLDATCLQVLKQSINCEEAVADLGVREYHGSLEDDKLTDAVCAASCKTALTTARRRMEGACSKTPEVLPGMTVLSFIDSIITGWDETCLKDKETGEYCNDVIDALEEEYEEIEEIPEEGLCSYCYGEKLRLMQKSEYSAYDEYYAEMLDYVNEKCGVDSPTTPINDPPQNNGTQPGECLSGKTVVTSAGDTCDSLAVANSVSAASLYYINANLPDCANIEAGTELCLPQTCTTYTAQEGDSCVEVGVEAGVSWMNIIEWNPMLDARCSNLYGGEPFWGHVICISAPGGEFDDGGSGGDGDDDTGNGNSGGEGGSGNGYSDIIVDPPEGAQLGEGTTLNCGYFIQAEEGVGCAKMIVAASRSTPMNLFLEVNPSLKSAAECDANLKPGLWYCLSPHYYWDVEQPTNEE